MMWSFYFILFIPPPSIDRCRCCRLPLLHLLFSPSPSYSLLSLDLQNSAGALFLAIDLCFLKMKTGNLGADMKTGNLGADLRKKKNGFEVGLFKKEEKWV
ncbi:MAG: hypothetical protein Q8835_02660 [Sweet potato little leaf phytoplasma]|nr:hypothetical protein [Sweet potato little leaf phytoplasma]